MDWATQHVLDNPGHTAREQIMLPGRCETCDARAPGWALRWKEIGAPVSYSPEVTTVTVELPIYTRMNGQEINLGTTTLEMPVKVTLTKDAEHVTFPPEHPKDI